MPSNTFWDEKGIMVSLSISAKVEVIYVPPLPSLEITKRDFMVDITISLKNEIHLAPRPYHHQRSWPNGYFTVTII